MFILNKDRRLAEKISEFQVYGHIIRTSKIILKVKKFESNRSFSWVKNDYVFKNIVANTFNDQKSKIIDNKNI